jgi:hypothetical protein
MTNYSLICHALSRMLKQRISKTLKQGSIYNKGCFPLYNKVSRYKYWVNVNDKTYELWARVMSWSYGKLIYNYLCNQCLSPQRFEFEYRSGELYSSLCDKVGQWPATGWCFSQGTTVSSINKTDCNYLNEILLKVDHDIWRVK